MKIQEKKNEQNYLDCRLQLIKYIEEIDNYLQKNNNLNSQQYKILKEHQKNLKKHFKKLLVNLKSKYGKEFNQIEKKISENKKYHFIPVFHKKRQSTNLNFFEEHENFITNNRQNIELIFDKEPSSLNLTFGSQDPISLIIEKIHQFCQKLNWKYIEDKNLVKPLQNFDALNIPLNHPSRNENECFYLNVENDWMLRTHTTTMTTKQLLDYSQNNKKRYVYTIGNVYRDDTDDKTHLPQFKQFDVCLIDHNLSLANLKWILIKFCQYIFDSKIKTRFRHNFFPFTQPSLELDISCLFCRQKGCSVCKKSGWIELLGCGIIRSQVLKKCNIKQDITVLAFGVGIERLAMLKYKINDIRFLYTKGWMKKAN